LNQIEDSVTYRQEGMATNCTVQGQGALADRHRASGPGQFQPARRREETDASAQQGETMTLIPALTRMTLAAALAALICDAASAQSMKSANDASTFLDRQCREWSATAKRGAGGSEAQRAAAANQASIDAKVAIEVVDFAPEVSDSDIASAVSKFRSCLDRAGKDAFGDGTLVTISFNPRIKNAKLPRTLDGEIKASPGPKKK
jgi:hypothetical protein